MKKLSPSRSRRSFIQALSVVSSFPMLVTLNACGSSGNDSPPTTPNTNSGATSAYTTPSEEHQHLATYMAFASNADRIWAQPSNSNAGLDRVRSDLIDLAKAIGGNEKVYMMVLSDAELAIAQGLLNNLSVNNPRVDAIYAARATGSGVEFIVVPAGFNDYWTRDTAPIFVKNSQGQLAAVNFNFNGWGNANSLSTDPTVPTTSNKSKKASFYQPYSNDQKVAPYIAGRNNAPMIKSSLTLEGGALELDGEGTAIITESSVLHVNRNPQLFDLTLSGNQVTGGTLKPTAKATVLAELQRTLGVTKVIWMTGTKVFPTSCTVAQETDITNGHTDFYAKFIAPGIVAYAFDPNDATGEQAITAQNLAQLTGQTDAKGRPLTLIPLVVPTLYGSTLSDGQKANFAAGYINFYVCNGAIILPKFGDATQDAAAVTALMPYKGTRQIIQVDILGIASGGGGLHCATTQVPA